jgi:hypothetical protein
VNRYGRQLPIVLWLVACASPAGPRASLSTPAGTRALDAWYSIYLVPLEQGGFDEVNVVVTFVDPSWGCSSDAGAPAGDTASFEFENGARATSLVLSRSGPLLGPTTAGSGQLTATTVDDRYLGHSGNQILVGNGGHVAGDANFDFGAGLRLTGAFAAAHCAAFDFRNAP